ncbi:unnamed protein product [Mesocestoides corti]|uniref:Uncharacterized protein n=1 Tax=Mesocestoides corti TaxID=53468 RepID=A0A158QTE6_MESCO|nr:unnamed protein product [Mesocestoides corti]
MSSCGQRASTFALARSEKATTATAVRTTDVSCAQAKSTLHEDALLFAGGDAPGRFCSVHQRRRVSRSTNSTNNVLKTTPGVRSAVLLKACLHNERSTLREKKAIHVGLRKSPHERRLLRIHHQSENSFMLKGIHELRKVEFPRVLFGLKAYSVDKWKMLSSIHEGDAQTFAQIVPCLSTRMLQRDALATKLRYANPVNGQGSKALTAVHQRQARPCEKKATEVSRPQLRG